MVTRIFAEGFWEGLERLVRESEERIDRVRGSRHPRYPDFVYPLDYGYLQGTKAADGGGIDVWRGTMREVRVTGVICTVDHVKRDSEIKVLLGCTREEAQLAWSTHNSGMQVGLLVERE